MCAGDHVRRRAHHSGRAADEGGMRRGGGRAGYHVYFLQEVAMKVIVLDRPKVLSFFLRMMYGIKKETETE